MKTADGRGRPAGLRARLHRARPASPAAYMELVIADTGEGISPEAGSAHLRTVLLDPSDRTRARACRRRSESSAVMAVRSASTPCPEWARASGCCYPRTIDGSGSPARATRARRPTRMTALCASAGIRRRVRAPARVDAALRPAGCAAGVAALPGTAHGTTALDSGTAETCVLVSAAHLRSRPSSPGVLALLTSRAPTCPSSSCCRRRRRVRYRPGCVPGARDCVTDDQLSRLAPAIERELEAAAVRRERRTLGSAVAARTAHGSGRAARERHRA